MKTVVVAVENCGNPPHAFSAAEGQEKLRRRMSEKGVFRPIEQFFHVGDQGRDPTRVFAIDFPRKMHKLAQLPVIRHRQYFDWIQDFSLSPAWPTAFKYIPGDAASFL
jgi:hypothetical protein